MKLHFSHENVAVDNAPDRPPDSVHRSSPMASHGLVVAPGLQGFHFQGVGAGAGAVAYQKNAKTAIEEVALLYALPSVGIWGWGCRVCIVSLKAQAGDGNPHA